MSSNARRPGCADPSSVGSKHDRRVHVAVAGVADDADDEAALGGDRVAAVEELRDPRPRHRDVVDERAAQLLERGQRHPAGGEQQVALRGVVGGVHQVRARLAAQLGQGRDLGRGRLGLPLSDCATSSACAVAVEVGLEQVVDRADAGVVHDLEQAGHQAAGHHPLDDLPGLRRRREGGHQGDRPLRCRRSASVASVMTPRVPSEPTNSRQVVARHALDRPPPGAQHAPVGEDDLQAQHVVGGDAVLHAAQAAGVGGEVAADRAPVVAGRVRRIEQPGSGDGVAQRLVHHAGLDDGEPVGRRDLEDGVHPGHHQA